MQLEEKRGEARALGEGKKEFYEKQDDLNKLRIKVRCYKFRHSTKQMKLQAITMHFGQKVRQKCQLQNRKEGRLTASLKIGHSRGCIHCLEAWCIIFFKFCLQRNGLTFNWISFQVTDH